jgi:hypothetical protein
MVSTHQSETGSKDLLNQKSANYSNLMLSLKIEILQGFCAGGNRKVLEIYSETCVSEMEGPCDG